MNIRKPGFTLFELVLVLGIMAVVSIFIVPSYQLFLSQAQLSAATSQVAELMRLQQQQTVSEQKIYGFTISANTLVVAYLRCTNADCTTTVSDNYTVGPTTIAKYLCENVGCTAKTVSLYTLPSSIVVSSTSFSSQTDIRFSTAGAPSTSGSLRLRDTTRNRYRTIDLRPTGAILYNTPETSS